MALSITYAIVNCTVNILLVHFSANVAAMC